jgi:hypothetical protein
MVKIPEKRTSEASLTTQGISPEMASSGGQMLETAGKGLEGLAQSWEKLRDKNETTRATLALTKKIDDIHINAMKDPDIWNAGAKAQTEIDKAVDETSQMVSGAEARELYMNKAGMIGERKFMVLNTSLMAKQAQQGKADDLALIDAKGQEWLNAAEGKDKIIIEGEISQVAKEAIATGHVHPDAMRTHMDAFWKQLHTGQIDHDIELSLNSEADADSPAGIGERG